MKHLVGQHANSMIGALTLVCAYKVSLHLGREAFIKKLVDCVQIDRLVVVLRAVVSELRVLCRW